MNENIKRYLFSSLTTFISGFALAILPFLDGLTLDQVKTGALAGILFAGIRAGVKAVIELAIHKKS
jgi:riboflavin transporter FmnP